MGVQNPSQSPTLQALVSLMDDLDPRIWQAVEEKLLSRSGETTALLRSVAERADKPVVRVRARRVLEKIHEAQLREELGKWVNPGGPEPELEEGWFLLTRLEFPDLDVDHYRRKLDAMAADMDPLLRGRRDLEILRILQRYFSREKMFRGNVEAYYEPENSFINCVLDRGLGIPVSLSAVYLLIARRLALPIEGIGAPGHFFLRYRRDRTSLQPVYIDAFHGGRLLSRTDCVDFLRSIGQSPPRELDTPASSREILARMCRNLIAIYGSAGPADKAERLMRWLEIIRKGVLASRDADSDPSRGA